MIGGKEKTVSPDTVLKNYWNGNAEFADLFNAVLFGGSQVIKPYELENEDTEASAILAHRKHMQGIRAARDNIKIQKKSTVYGVQFVLLGLESQEHIHYAMPLRVMGYDYATYKKQYDTLTRQYKEHKTDMDEHMSMIIVCFWSKPDRTICIFIMETTGIYLTCLKFCWIKIIR